MSEPKFPPMPADLTHFPNGGDILPGVESFGPVARQEDAHRPPLTHVAIRFRGKVWSLPRPYRHHHIIRTICTLDPDVDHVDARDEDQGFLDESGRYLNRKQALASAEENDQIRRGKLIGSVLTSEDLW